MAVNYITVDKPNLPFKEIVFDPNMEILDSAVSFCRTIESLDTSNLVLKSCVLSLNRFHYLKRRKIVKRHAKLKETKKHNIMIKIM